MKKNIIWRNILSVFFVFIHITAFAQTNEFGYPIVPNIKSNDNTPVGSVPGSFSVSAAGSATYSIPIEIPKGIGGSEPSVGIVYSSQAGNGIVGWGCNIIGMSVISRAVTDIYHDGKATGIHYGKEGPFCLDGQRLVQYGSLMNGDSVLFHPEFSPHTRVVLHGLSSSSQAQMWFAVYTPEGMYYEYGCTPDSKQTYTKDGEQKVNAWYLDMTKTPFGIYNKYSYSQLGNILYPQSISYGNNIISFEYENRPDIIKSSIEGIAAIINKRLKNINSYTTADGSKCLFRKYTFLYTCNDGTTTSYSRLSSIREVNGNNESLHPTILSWDTPQAFNCEKIIPHLDSNMAYLGTEMNNVSFVAADLNGDGLSDIIQKGRTHQTYGNGENDFNYIRTYYSHLNEDGVVNFKTGNIINLKSDYSQTNNLLFRWTEFRTEPIVANVDDDGENELIVPEFFSTDDGCHFGFYVCHSGDSELSTGVKYIDQHVKEFDDILWTAGDYNNDGITEFIVLEKQSDGSSYYGALMGGFNKPNVGNPFEAYNKPFRFSLPQKPQHIFSVDMNCDGLTDIVTFYDKGYSVFFNDGTWLDKNIASPYHPHCISYNTNQLPYKVWPGDFNGDGITDFLLCGGGPESGALYYEIGNGDGTLSQKHAYDLDVVSSHKKDKDYFSCNVFDYDGDGKTDAIVSRLQIDKFILIEDGDTIELPGYITRNANIYWLLSDGERLVLQKKTVSDQSSYCKPQFHLQGDFNGDGLQEFAAYSYDCYDNTSKEIQFRLYSNKTFLPSSGRVTKITDGYGRGTTIDYSTIVLPNVNLQKTRTQKLKFPVVQLPLPLAVVSSVTSDNGVVGKSTMLYRYGMPLVHLQGRGILGMPRTQTTDMTTGLVSDYTVDEWEPSLFLPRKTTEKQTLRDLTATKTTTNEFYTFSRSTWSVPEKILFTDFDDNKRYEITKYSPIWGVIYYHEIYYDYPKNSEYESTFFYDYDYKGGRYNPTDIVYRKYKQGQETYEKATTCTYNDMGLLDSTTVYAGTDMAVTTTYTYDGYGNRLTEKVTAHGVTPVCNSWEYDDSHRFISKHIENGLSETHYTYDIWGNLKTETDYTRSENPLTTTYNYDNWGNLESTISPLGLKSTYTCGWGDSQSKRFFKVTQGQSQPWVKTWYDAVGREVKVESINALDQLTTQTTSYNNRGLVEAKKSVTGDITVTQYYSYDERDRCRSDSVADNNGTLNQVTKYEYGKNWKSETKDNRTTKYILDDWGNASKVITPQDTVSYTYYASGLPSSVTSCGHTVTMEYDVAGNKTKLTDPDAGTMIYTYDALGRIKTQKDARNLSLSYTYDSNGRAKSGPVGGCPSASYIYGTSANDKDLLLSKKTGDYQIFYVYDDYGRIKAKQYSIPDVGFRTFEYTYNKDGQVATETYPDGTILKFQYDAYGNHIATTKDGTNIWKLRSSTGSETQWQLGKDYLLTEKNSAIGLSTSKSLKRGTEQLHDMTFTYNPSTSNLVERTGMMSYIESFAYDAQERLTHATANTGTQTFSYSVDGNILSKTDIGSYSYDDRKPHAVTSVDNELYLIPDNQQTVTYNEMGKATLISEANGPSMSIAYGPDGERWIGVFTDGNKKKTILYLGDYEEIIDGNKSQKLCYLDGGALLLHDYDGTSRLCVLFTDHLGSITRIYDEDGNELFHATYDAWGRQEVTRNGIGFRRGYTGHEMLPEFGLINMNGRMYDPLLGRFLSTDNYVQEPTNSQNFNRYSYCLNNPLKYTDPSGEVFGIDDLICVSIMAYVGGMLSNISHCKNTRTNIFNPGNWNWSSAGTYLGLAGGVLNGLGVSTNVSGMITNGLLHACGNVVINGITNVSEHRDFFDNWLLSAGFGFVEGAIRGYFSSKAKGANYWWGNGVKYNRTQWSFINTDKPDYTIKMMQTSAISREDNDCLASTMTEAENELGGNRTYEDFSEMVKDKKSPEGVEIKTKNYIKLLEDNFPIKETPKTHELFDAQYMTDVANSGDVITVHFTAPGHADNVRELRVFVRAPEKNTLVFRQSMFNANQMQFNYKNKVSFFRRIGK